MLPPTSRVALQSHVCTDSYNTLYAVKTLEGLNIKVLSAFQQNGNLTVYMYWYVFTIPSERRSVFIKQRPQRTDSELLHRDQTEPCIVPTLVGIMGRKVSLPPLWCRSEVDLWPSGYECNRFIIWSYQTFVWHFLINVIFILILWPKMCTVTSKWPWHLIFEHWIRIGSSVHLEA